ncbi:His-Xaa-Ser system radical SAM maturase HxsC [Phaeobacter gallaeciensis]|uniref:His-Xaa-Ser system radical SAM maturase HxsC n=1 Tax=Phaeobacter gallaeciensis TaxID=60890 RepID=UPI00237F271C|nr:His-Xaa-Ser system radical SAM maturase HxsC [Phaeobacter gallaeciensis]MDE4191253.1 His-Xaa-Ser system radical SAM maturase HxsC [Phaeobacter gallaeciensis]MDE4199718.1 His-Xaa-Ser system radical SAM maturase HxsC [Phaeobacter gallaeciensis]MDE4203866.1 His-Xaa-Ser system radical SAM maturase HxsC [Phaeobacter gallaeciensis]MDE4208008.1 His-Xaa-Ser system radical SAM maturase HxsC [Phaeobacter gallaeciensis]MDE4216375.1 His-Xaa-Ser system radical SAM maturase HxsC [Phaeobacter gallaeciensi
MIALRLAAKGHLEGETLVARLVTTHKDDRASFLGRDYQLTSQEGVWAYYSRDGHTIALRGKAEDLDGDVIMLPPNASSAHRLIRANSQHNSLLITELCDQLCVMCSQPPKTTHTDMFAAFMLACVMAPQDAVIGISGGEPMLFKEQLLALLMQVHAERPDLTFHVLTNGQHFEPEDVETLRSPAFNNVLWAIPVFADAPEVHDRIVCKAGAFEQLLETFELLSHTSAQIEIRTVVMQSNQAHLAALADFLTTYIPFASQWSIMQMEKIGFGRMNWRREFFDTSTDFAMTARALCIAHGRGLEARLFNFPLCTVPSAYQRYAVASISDWKCKFEDFCEGCGLRDQCGGFFEWYEVESGFEAIGYYEKA